MTILVKFAIALSFMLVTMTHQTVAQTVDGESETNLPGADIVGERCNAGSVGCECLVNQADGVKCGYMAECRTDARDGKARCVLKR